MSGGNLRGSRKEKEQNNTGQALFREQHGTGTV